MCDTSNLPRRKRSTVNRDKVNSDLPAGVSRLVTRVRGKEYISLQSIDRTTGDSITRSYGARRSMAQALKEVLEWRRNRGFDAKAA